MKKVFKLYIDELGMSHPKSFEKSPYYILVGCIIDEYHQKDLEDHANNIKFKYWGKTNVIFHSAEMARNLGDFEIFDGNEKLKQEFEKDIFKLLQNAPVTITAAIIDQEKAYKSFWAEKTVISRSAEKVLFNFLAFIYTKVPCRGKVIIEASSGYRDVEYLAAFNELLSPNLQRKYPEFSNVREYLTSINFVTKQNHDIESQVADLLAYGIRCIQEVKKTGVAYPAKSYEAKIMKIVSSKLIKMSPTMKDSKKKYFEKIESLSFTPKKITKPKEKRA